jgi:hypothetical protein
MRTLLLTSVACVVCAFVATIARAEEAAVALCGKPIPDSRFSMLLPRQDGSSLNLVVATSERLRNDADCKPIRTGLPIEAIEWLGALPRVELGDESRIALTVREAGEIVSLEVDNPPKTMVRQLIPRAEILPVANYRIFGSEARVVAQPDVTAFVMTCHPGQKPAGVILELGAAPADVVISLDLLVTSTDGFQAQIVRSDHDAKDAGQVVAAGAQATITSLPIPADARSSLVLSCPQVEGKLRIERGTIRSAAARKLDPPSAWVWEPDVWQRHPERLLEVASRLDLARLYTTIPISKGKVLEPERLTDFVGAARAQGIEVVAVEGDPDMIYPGGRANALERARALADYNTHAVPNSRLDGVQYDIEPYLSPSYAAQTGVAWQLWAETIQQLSAVVETKIEVAVPYWILEAGGGSAALENASPAIDRLIIMAYRTDPAAIVSAAAPLLSWSARHALPATVALEAGPLAPERRKVYVKSLEGDLHVIRLDDVAAVVMLNRALASSTGRTYRLSHTGPSQVARVTFDGDIDTAFKVGAKISKDLAAWPSLERIAYHGLPEVSSAAFATRARAEGHR